MFSGSIEGRVAPGGFLDLESQFSLSVTTLVEVFRDWPGKIAISESITGSQMFEHPSPHQSSGFIHVLGTTFREITLSVRQEVLHLIKTLKLFCKKDESTVSLLLKYLQYLQVLVGQVVFFNLKTTFLASAGEYCRPIWQTQVCLRDCFVT